MNLNEIYNEISRRSDTKGTKINAAETRRVIATFFDCLEDLTAREAAEVIAKGLNQAAKRRR